MKSISARPHTARDSRLSAGLAAFLITLVVGPVSAAVDDVPIPPEPLSVGAPVPPNLVLLLDDSGSMGWEYMYYNPDLRVFETTRDSAGRVVGMNFSMTSGTGWNATPSINSLAYDPRVSYRPWQNPDGSDKPEMDPDATFSQKDLLAAPISLYRQGTHWFYVAKPGITNPRDLGQYTLHKLIDENQAQTCTTADKDPLSGRWKKPGLYSWPEGICQNVTRFQWTTPDGSVITRSLAEEWRNYANWYGYHRTRMKVAKAAISRTFSRLDENVRVGYAVLNYPSTRNFDIPVQTANGQFKGENRTKWFDRVYSETSPGGTPLRRALQLTGDYFKRNDPRGPWGPEPVERQIACRQNFVILATDGEWGGDNVVGVGNEDGTDGEVMTSPSGTSYQYKPAPPYRDTYSVTLADVAMKYWKQDLRPDLPNVVPTTEGNPAFWQHMVTFTISIGMKGSLDPVADWPRLVAGTKAWPDPTYGDLYKVDDLFHASVNGHGTYVSAMDPEALNEGLQTALGAISERTASASSLALDGTTLDAGGRSFVASYLPGPWSGDLKAYTIASTGVSPTELWSAAEGIPAPDQRRIYTHPAPGSQGAWNTKAFPTGDQEKALTAEVAAWIGGDRALEGTRLRARKSLLGDIVHSSPVHVRTVAGTEAVFVGANDGMLHVFDAATGKELLAYVPGLLDMQQLKALSQAKPFRHRYFVDGPLAVARDDVNGNKVRVVGTLGRGGRGVYGLSLDLARPDQRPVSWEFIDDGMGQVLSRPQLAIDRRYAQRAEAVIVSNGINSPDGKAALYVLEPRTGELRGKIPAGDETGNGLSTPTLLDVDGDGKIDRAYAGDLRGNVWRFDLAGSASEWRASRIFTATDAEGNRQPITGGVGVAWHPLTHRPWVFFGTGSYLTAADAASLATQSWYGVEDSGSPASRSELMARKITINGTAGGKPVRAFEKARANDMIGKRGWVVDLRTPGVAPEGERMIGESQQIIGGRTLMAASIVPTGGGCGGNGRGYLNAIDAFTGGATSTPFFDINGDGKFDGQDGPNGTSAGSVDLGLGMISDPGILLGKLTGAGENVDPSRTCVSGGSGTTDCIAFDAMAAAAGRYGRVSWAERIEEP